MRMHVECSKSLCSIVYSINLPASIPTSMRLPLITSRFKNDLYTTHYYYIYSLLVYIHHIHMHNIYILLHVL